MIFRLTPLVFTLTVLPVIAAAVVLALLTMPHQAPIARYAAVLTISYLLGSIPWGYMMILWREGVDIREQGSGRTGMTNVLRTAGAKGSRPGPSAGYGEGILSVFLARQVIAQLKAK